MLEEELIYENPVTENNLKIKGIPDQLITLIDMNGKEFKIELKNNLLPVSTLQNGMYFFHTEAGIKRYKILILK